MLPEPKTQNSPGSHGSQGCQSPSLVASAHSKPSETPNSKRREQPPTPSSHRKTHANPQKQHSNVEIFVVLGVVLEALWHRPRRPLREMIQKPQLPQRDMYQYRVFVNLLWYAKNYLLLMLAWMMFFSMAYPLILLNLAFFIVLRGLNHRLYIFGKKERALQKLEKKKLTKLLEGDGNESPEADKGVEPVSDASPEPSLLDVHLKAHQGYFARQTEQKAGRPRRGSKSTPGQGTSDSLRPPPLDLGEAEMPHSTQASNDAAAKLRDDAALTTLISHGVKFLQLLCCIAVIRSYGLAAPIFVTVAPVMIIAAHSALTPYGDDSASLFESTMSTAGGSLDAPATPVLSFEPTSFAATRERFERQREGPKESTPSNEALKLDVRAEMPSVDGRASPAQVQFQQRPGSPSQLAIDRALSTSTTSPLPFGSGAPRATGGFRYGQQRRSTMSGLASSTPREPVRGALSNRNTSLQNIEELADAMSYLGGTRRNGRQQSRSTAQVTSVGGAQ